jgi:hypothetical protein
MGRVEPPTFRFSGAYAHDSHTDQEKIMLIGQLHLLGRWHAGAVTLRLYGRG